LIFSDPKEPHDSAPDNAKIERGEQKTRKIADSAILVALGETPETQAAASPNSVNIAARLSVSLYRKRTESASFSDFEKAAAISREPMSQRA
jgi:hypothetical protein